MCCRLLQLDWFQEGTPCSTGNISIMNALELFTSSTVSLAYAYYEHHKAQQEAQQKAALAEQEAKRKAEEAKRKAENQDERKANKRQKHPSHGTCCNCGRSETFYWSYGFVNRCYCSHCDHRRCYSCKGWQ